MEKGDQDIRFCQGMKILVLTLKNTICRKKKINVTWSYLLSLKSGLKENERKRLRKKFSK